MQNKIERIYSLDMLRFIAALIVMGVHFCYTGESEHLYAFTFPTLSEIFRYGFLGVDLFFIISGFVILMSVKNKTASGFVLSRILRLYPAFWVSVTLTAVICALWGPTQFMPTLSQYIANMTMLHTFIDFKSIDSVYWTLVIELKFYFFIFVLMCFKKIDYILVFLYIWLLITVASNVSYRVSSLFGSALILSWSYYFIAGAIFYLIRINGINKHYMFILATCYAIALYRIPMRIEYFEIHYGGEFSVMICSIILTCIFGVVSLVALGKLNFTKHAKICTFLGSLSYPLYLIHQYIGLIYMGKMEPYLNKYLILASALVLMIIASYGILFLEKLIAQRLRPLLQKILK